MNHQQLLKGDEETGSVFQPARRYLWFMGDLSKYPQIGPKKLDLHPLIILHY